LSGDVQGVRDTYLATIDALRSRTFSAQDVSQRVRLTKSPDQYLTVRDRRRELPYEALLANGRIEWSIGDRVRVYRKQNGEGGLVDATEDESLASTQRDYDADYYVRLLRETFAARLVRAFTPSDFAAVFADPEQLSLFPVRLDQVTPVLTTIPGGLSR
jgi:DNA polymerase, archaea type